MTVHEKEKLHTLAENNGFDALDEFLESVGCDSVVPGICVGVGCDYTTDVEPDCHDGYCEECEGQTVRSALVLAGIH